MANQHQTFAWYRAPISYQFSLCRRSIGTLAEGIESDKEDTLSAWAETAESISDPVIREGVWLHLASEGYDLDILNEVESEKYPRRIWPCLGERGNEFYPSEPLRLPQC